MYKSNKFCDILKSEGQNGGVTALIGSGGKTSLMMKLASELAGKGRTIVCTSTHIMRPENIPVAETLTELHELIGKGTSSDRAGSLSEEGGMWYYRDPSGGEKHLSPVCLGTPAAEGKLTTPVEKFEEIAGSAEYVIVEADGSKRLPLKCHAAHEPVIPDNAGLVILVIGLSGIGRKAGEAVHRPELFEKLTGLAASDTVTADAVSDAVLKELPVIMGNDRRRFCVFINQADTEADMDIARGLAAGLKGICCYAGSVRAGHFEQLSQG